MRRIFPLLLPAIALMSATLASTVQASGLTMADRLQAAAPDADPVVLQLAANALTCATAHGMTPSPHLAVIDYSRASSTPRLWVFDIREEGRLLYRELVAHGKNTGDNMARHFSNDEGSLQTSIGLFRTMDTYTGGNGYSMRMDGLEPGFNDQALKRYIVMHGAPYVNEDTVRKLGRLGRSWGCPAVRSGVARQIIDTLKGGQFVFSYYPDKKWLSRSRFLNCTPSVAQLSRRQAERIN
ncbi:MAG TPA: murein L,D-transpeptidase catalytic domain family protein [Moraxellaceae bacterium]|nr:murein L,D-transpeptidase catalytic domain family protein [Moraxellaceae bacterium]